VSLVGLLRVNIEAAADDRVSVLECGSPLFTTFYVAAFDRGII